jgi:hypothetical protein
MTIHITASGDYARDMPEELVNALRAAIRQHMKAYGLTNVYVLTNSAVDPLASEEVKGRTQ